MKLCTLIIIISDGYIPPKSEKAGQIILTHERFSFNASHKTIAWRVINSAYCSTSLVFTVTASSCDSNDHFTIATTHSLQLTLSNLDLISDGGKLLHLKILASDAEKSECSLTSATFQVLPDGKYVLAVC